MAEFSNTFAINGVIDTSRDVLSNLQALASAAGAWVTYDITQGKWAFVINRAGTSIKSFTDSNIVGSINISGTGITELYNSVEIEFPHRDLKDRKDYITFDIDSSDRFPNEPDNKLNIGQELVNNPVQAQLLASRELKQSRVDKVIEFRTDYSAMGLRAGDLIDVTNTMYGFTNKLFRIITINESDDDDGQLVLSITALEYDADVYDTTGLIYSEKTIDNGIISKDTNTAVKAKDGESAGFDLTKALLGAGGAGLLLSLLNSMTRTSGDSAFGLAPTAFSFKTSFISATVTTGAEVYISTGYSSTIPITGYYRIKYNINWGGGASGSTGPNGTQKNSAIAWSRNGVFFDPTNNAEAANSSTGDNNVQIFEDHIIEAAPIYFQQGDTVQFYFAYATTWPTAQFLINGELQLVQRA
jgi:hypothetical protein